MHSTGQARATVGARPTPELARTNRTGRPEGNRKEVGPAPSTGREPARLRRRGDKVHPGPGPPSAIPPKLGTPCYDWTPRPQCKGGGALGTVLATSSSGLAGQSRIATGDPGSGDGPKVAAPSLTKPRPGAQAGPAGAVERGHSVQTSPSGAANRLKAAAPGKPEKPKGDDSPPAQSGALAKQTTPVVVDRVAQRALAAHPEPTGVVRSVQAGPDAPRPARTPTFRGVVGVPMVRTLSVVPTRVGSRTVKGRTAKEGESRAGLDSPTVLPSLSVHSVTTGSNLKDPTRVPGGPVTGDSRRKPGRGARTNGPDARPEDDETGPGGRGHASPARSRPASGKPKGRKESSVVGGPVPATHGEPELGPVGCTIQLGATTVVPAGKEVIVAGRVMGPGACSPGRVLLIEPLEDSELPTGIGIARVLVSGTGSGLVPVRVYNGGEGDQQLTAGCLMATADPVRVVDDSPGRPAVGALRGVTAATQLPPELESLWQTARSDPLLSAEGATGLKELLLRHPSVFAKDDADLGCAWEVVHDIVTTTEQPLRQYARKSGPDKLKAEKELVREMREKGVIEPTSSPWASPTVLVQKKDGTVRFCVDYRRLNELTVKDAFPLPRIDETLDSLGGAKWFTTLDLLSGYWQVGLTDDAKRKSAFCTHSGNFQWRVMPFGLCNAPATFERLMETVLRGLNWESCLVYLDDVIVFGRTEAQLLDRMDAVFKRLTGAGLKLKPTKCKLFVREVDYLGHVISADGVRVDPKKIESVAAWPVPRTATQVRSFLGLASYYRRFVEHFAAVAAPLHAITGANSQFRWDEEQQSAFEELKRRLGAASVLAYPDRQAEVILSPGHHGAGVGAVLSQRTPEGERTVAYMSTVMSPSQTRYCSTRRELLALVTALRHFRPYLYGRKVIVRVDRSALEWLHALKDPPGLPARWSDTLAGYDLDVQHRPGEDHAADRGIQRQNCPQCLASKHSPTPEATVAWCGSKVPEVAWPEFTDAQLRLAQQRDGTLSRVLLAMEDKGLPTDRTVSGWSEGGRALALRWTQLEVRNGVLYLADTPDRAAPEFVRLRLLVPRSLQSHYLAAAHHSGGHGTDPVVWTRLEASVLWWSMRLEVRAMCRACPECQRVSGPEEQWPAMATGPDGSDRFAGWPEGHPTMARIANLIEQQAGQALRTSEQIRQAQLADRHIGWLVRAKEDTGRPSPEEIARHGTEGRCYAAKWDNLEMHRGVLCIRTWYRTGYSKVRLLAPKPFRYPDYVVCNRLLGPEGSVADLCSLMTKGELWWEMESDIRGWSIGRKRD